MLKRSLVMPLPKDTNLLNQVCQGIDWEEAKRLLLCWLQRGAGLWNRITRGQAASERIFITRRGSDTKGRSLEMWLSCGRQGLGCCLRHVQQDLSAAIKWQLLSWPETMKWVIVHGGRQGKIKWFIFFCFGKMLWDNWLNPRSGW